MGHRGVINKIVFYPEVDSFRMVTTAEDGVIKVWDLVMRAEIQTLKVHKSMVTGIEFTGDRAFMISGGRDGRIGVYNVKENYKVVSVFSKENSDIMEDEINAIKYHNITINE